jgi:hypothetical protein
MTIGIAAAGPRAGWAILNTLARLEPLAEGAIGGFLSVAVMHPDGQIQRAHIQSGGARALMDAGFDPAIGAANRAVLMSSGPNRPEPLSQFTPARPDIGLVTGHRFPNTLDCDGMLLGESALSQSATGTAPDRICAEIMARNPRADAGLILLDKSGRIGLANSALVATYPDAGKALIVRSTYTAAVLHNAIRPSDSLAALVIEMVSEQLRTEVRSGVSVELHAGVPVSSSDTASAIMVEANRVVALRLATMHNGDALWSAGLGPQACLVKDGHTIGFATIDPFLLIRDGNLISANGKQTIQLPFVPK